MSGKKLKRWEMTLGEPARQRCMEIAMERLDNAHDMNCSHRLYTPNEHDVPQYVFRGVLCELACAVLLKCKWTGEEHFQRDTEFAEVKSVEKKHHQLVVQPTEFENGKNQMVPYVLIWQKEDNLFEALGWMWGRDVAKYTPAMLTSLSKEKSHNVPPTDLCSMEEFPDVAKIEGCTNAPEVGREESVDTRPEESIGETSLRTRSEDEEFWVEDILENI